MTTIIATINSTCINNNIPVLHPCCASTGRPIGKETLEPTELTGIDKLGISWPVDA